MKKIEKKELAILVCVLLLAGFFRFFRLSSVPPGLYPDEALNGNQALEEPGKVFYPENNGREGLFVNLLSLSFRLFGVSLFSLRIVPSFFGFLTVLGLYLLGREAFSPKAGLAAAFLSGVSFWHVNFSRIGFRAVLTPFFLVFASYFLLRARKKREKREAILAGLFYGLGFYTYISYRFSVLLLVPVFLFWWKKTEKERRDRFLELAGFFLGTLFLVALPIGLYFLIHPSHFTARAGGVSIFTAENPGRAFSRSLLAHLQMFHFRGDPNWRHNLAGKPVLFWPTGFFFLLGLFYSILKTARKQKASAYQLLIIGFFVMLLPGILTREGVPHSLRVIGAAPAAFLLAGLGFSKLTEEVQNRVPLQEFPKLRVLLIFLLLLFLPAFLLAAYSRYFLQWGKSEEAKAAFSSRYLRVGRLLNKLEGKKYVLVNQGGVLVDGLPIPAQTPVFIQRTEEDSGEQNTVYLRPKEVKKAEKGAVLVPLLPKEETNLKIVNAFPQAEVERRGIFYFRN